MHFHHKMETFDYFYLSFTNFTIQIFLQRLITGNKYEKRKPLHLHPLCFTQVLPQLVECAANTGVARSMRIQDWAWLLPLPTNLDTSMYDTNCGKCVWPLPVLHNCKAVVHRCTVTENILQI